MDHVRIPGRARRAARAVLAGAGALALVAVAGCGSSDEPAPRATSDSTVLQPEGDPVDGGTLAVATLNDVTGWNPTADQWGMAAAFAGSAMMEALTTLDANGEAQPWLATDWEPNQDFTSWTLTLRDGVTFHDGEVFDAAAVEANFDDVITSPLTGIALGGAVLGADVVDPRTVRIDLALSWASFPTSFLSGPNAWMRAPSMLEAAAAGKAEPVGTGPFKFESWEPGAALKLVRFDDYWVDGQPHLDEISFTPVADDSSRVSSLESGDVDVMITSSVRDANDLEGEYQVIKDWDTETTLLVVNTRETAGGEPNPLSNEHARKAVAHATDAQAIADFVGDDLEVPTSPFAADTPWHDPSSSESYPAFDLEQAEQEVEAYKEDTGESTLKVKLLGPNETNTIAVLQALDQQWAQAGIETEIEVQEHSAYAIQGVQGNFQLTYGPIFSAPDPDQNFHFWSKRSVADDGAIGINFSAFATDTTEEALTTGRGTGDFETRKAAYSKLIEEQNEAAVNIWLFFTPYSMVASDRVHGLQQFAELPWGNFQPKPWWGSVWIES